MQIRKLSKGYCENGWKRVEAMVEGVGAKTKGEAVAFMVEAKSLSTNATKLLQTIKSNMVSFLFTFFFSFHFFINQNQIFNFSFNHTIFFQFTFRFGFFSSCIFRLILIF